MLSSLCMALFISCNSAPPEKYFDVAVLNSNVVVGFAGKRMIYELENPSVRLDEKNGGTTTMKRAEMVDSKIEFAELMIRNLKHLKETDDTKTIIDASLAMYKFILPVYKNEYTKLAKLYDDGAVTLQIQQVSQALQDKYSSRFDTLYSKLIEEGKGYAKKYNIKVNWAE